MVNSGCVRPNMFLASALSAPLPGLISKIQPKPITRGGTAIQENIMTRAPTRPGMSVRSVAQAIPVAIATPIATLPSAYSRVLPARRKLSARVNMVA